MERLSSLGDRLGRRFLVLAAIGVAMTVGLNACAPTAAPSSAPTPPAVSPAVSPVPTSAARPAPTPGATVTWTNAGAVQHTVTDDPSKAVNAADAALPAGAAAWDSGPVNGGQTFSHTFISPGTYKYFCIPHESLGMLATITVT